jgi:predicted permease
MSSFIADLRYAYRRLGNGRASVVVVIVSIGLGVGVSTTIFGAVDRILFAPLPYPEPDRVVTLADFDADGARLDVAYGTFIEVAQRSRSFDALAVADRWQPALTASVEPERLEGDYVSTDYFRVLGVAPFLGRDFEAADDVDGSPRVAIVSASLATRRFGSADALLNRPIVLDGDEYTVVGIMPSAFENALSSAVEVWAPRRYRAQAPFQSAEWGHHLRMIGRLGAGVSLEQAQHEMITIGSSAAADFPRPTWASLERGLLLESLQASITGGARPALLAILGAVVLLLAISCANVTNILLARALARRSELAMRAALGAGLGRLVQQLFTESLLLALMGGVLGLGIAALGSRALVALAPAGLPRMDSIRFDARVFVFGIATIVVVTLVVGLLPALRGRFVGSHAGLQSGARTTATRHNILRHSLVVTQVALAVVLLTSAGLLLRSVERLLATPTGFDAANVVTMQVVTTARRDRSSEETLVFFQRALEAVRGLPGVVDAAFTSQLPLSGDSDAYGAVLESAPSVEGLGGAFRYAVTPSWFETMRIPLLRGRLLGADDRPGAPQAVLISESFAARRFPGRDPLGERIRLGPDMSRPDRPWGTVVGVVADVKQASLALASPDAFYVAMGQWSWIDDVQWLAVRVRGDAGALVPAIKQAIWSVDSTIPLVRIAGMADRLAASEAERTFALWMFSAFGLTALLLVGVGVYGVAAGLVTERTREIGVRSALGAAPGRLALLVVRQGLSLTALGVAIGMAAAAGATQWLTSLLFGVEPVDPLTYIGVLVLLLAVSLFACYEPARRAAGIDPAITLRAE